MSTRSLDIVLSELQLRPVDLAKESNLSVETVLKIVAGDIPSEQQRHRIEGAVNQAIWSTEQEFQDRARLRQAFGCEPSKLTERQLRDLAHKIGLRGYSKTAQNKTQLISALAGPLEEYKRKQEEEKRQVEALWKECQTAEADAEIAAHVEQLRAATWFECLKCGANLKAPDRTVSQDPPFKCPECGSSRVWPVA